MSVYVINDVRLRLIQSKQLEILSIYNNDDVLLMITRYHKHPEEFISNVNLQKLLLLVINYSAVTQPPTSVPTLNGCVSILTNTLKKAYPLLYDVKSCEQTVCFLKTSNDIEFTATTSEIINEATVGLLHLNKLNSGYFKYIYGAFGGGPLTDKHNLSASCNGINNDVFYMLEEKVNGQQLDVWLAENKNDTDYIKVYYQLIKALGEASSVGVNDFNINEGNILVRKQLAKVNITGSKKEFITNSIPCIVNFLRASFSNTPVIATKQDIDNLRQIFLSRLTAHGSAYQFITKYPTGSYNLPEELLTLLNG